MKPLGKMSGVWVLAIILGLTGASCAVQVTPDRRPPAASEPNAATKAKVQAAYGKLPLHFEPNQGQTDEQVHFLSRGRGYTLFLTSTEAVLALRKPHKNSLTSVSGSPTPTENSLAPVLGERVRVRGPDSEPTHEFPRPRFGGEGKGEEAVLRMKLVGANLNPRIQAVEELPGKVNYFIGNDPQKWHTNIPTYARVKYQDVYPGIDLIYYGNQRQLEHDFIVAPGADPRVIRIAFDGLVGAGMPPHPIPLVAQPSWLRAGWKPAPLGERGPMPSVFAPSPLAGEGQDGGESRLPLRIDDDGDLILTTAGGEVRLLKPRIYQEINGVKQPIPGGYVLPDLKTQNSELETQEVGFQVAAYDTTKPLIIDPVLSYSTYLGGSGYDQGYGIAVDSSGNAYVTGYTTSTDFPTVSAFQATNGGSFGTSDAFVTKLNVTGDTLVYSTYLGGSDNDSGTSIAVDSSSNAYVTGFTYSTNFPTANPLQAAYGGGSDAFVAKLNSTGSALVYSTYLGGSRSDEGYGIAVDSSGDAYVTGFTYSSDFPTASPLQATNAGNYDAFVTKVNLTGSALVYSTYLGGSSHDQGYGIAVDSSGNAYVTGFTYSPNFPTASPFQAGCFGGSGRCTDAFVAKLNSTGSALVYSTYLGGSYYDVSYGIAVDSSGNAYVTGFTYSPNFPTASPLQATNAGGYDAFVTKLNAAGNALVYSTFLGGSTSDSGRGIAVDSSGDAYVTGYTGSSDFPTASPLQATNAGSNDVFVTKLNAAGNALVYSTFLGGSYDDVSYGIAVDSSGNAYVAGRTESTNFPTASPLQATNAGSNDAFVAKLIEGFTLTVTKAGTGSGTVTSSPAGINCGTTCTASYSSDTTVTLTATADSGSIFSGWSGDCSGTESCVLSMTTNRSVTATFDKSPVLSVTPTSLDFGSVTVNSTKDLSFTVTNVGGGTLTGSVTASSPFSIVSGSSFSLGAGASQTVTVRFSPTTTGTFISLATVSSNVGNATVALSGTGTPSPALSVSTTSLDFGSVTVNSTKDLTFTVTNSGDGTLTGSVTASSPFSIISGSSFSLGAGASQVVTVRFSPTSTGTFTGTATVSSNGGSAVVSLSGTGVEEKVPLLLVTPTSLAFSSVTVGSSSDLSFTVTNSGGGTLTGTATTSLPYSVVSGSSFSLSAGATQTVIIRFNPTSTGAFADIVSVSSNGGNTSVTLSGTGIEVSNPLLSVFPTSLAFGEVAINSSKDLLFTVTNAGTGTLTGTVTASSPFSITSGSSFSLGTGASQTVTVRFSPTVESFVSSTAAVNSNGGNAVVTLTGTGITIQSPTLSVIPTSLDFGSVQVGSSSDLSFFVQNSGGGTLIGTVSTTAPGFSIVSGSSFTLTAGATQTVTVRFSPTEGGTFSGTVTVSSNGGGATVRVTGVGTGVPQPTLTITPSILNFGSVRVGKSKDLSFTVQNTGEGTLAGTATATDPFSVVTNSSFTLEAGDLVLVTVRFSPPTTGPFTGTVKFASNGGNVTAAVTGRGRGKLLPFGLREAVRVAIDIQPNSDANSIDCQSTGEIAVGILNVRELPSPIEVSTLELEGAVPQSWATADVDGDGAADDLVVHFKTHGVSNEACQEGAHSFFLTGELADGTPIEGSDEVNIVRGK